MQLLPNWKPDSLEFGNPAHKDWVERIGIVRGLLDALQNILPRRRNKKYRNKPPIKVLCRICDRYIKSGKYRVAMPLAAHESCYIATVNAVDVLLGDQPKATTERKPGSNASLF